MDSQSRPNDCAAVTQYLSDQGPICRSAADKTEKRNTWADMLIFISTHCTLLSHEASLAGEYYLISEVFPSSNDITIDPKSQALCLVSYYSLFSGFLSTES